MEEYRIRVTCFLILSFSIVLVASQGTSSSYLNKSWADEPLTLDNELMKYYIKIQDNSDSDNDQEMPIVPRQDSEDNNQTVNELTDEDLSEEDANQTVNELTDEDLRVVKRFLKTIIKLQLRYPVKVN